MGWYGFFLWRQSQPLWSSLVILARAPLALCVCKFLSLPLSLSVCLFYLVHSPLLTQLRPSFIEMLQLIHFPGVKSSLQEKPRWHQTTAFLLTRLSFHYPPHESPMHPTRWVKMYWKQLHFMFPTRYLNVNIIYTNMETILIQQNGTITLICCKLYMKETSRLQSNDDCDKK